MSNYAHTFIKYQMAPFIKVGVVTSLITDPMMCLDAAISPRSLDVPCPIQGTRRSSTLSCAGPDLIVRGRDLLLHASFRILARINILTAMPSTANTIRSVLHDQSPVLLTVKLQLRSQNCSVWSEVQPQDVSRWKYPKFENQRDAYEEILASSLPYALIILNPAPPTHIIHDTPDLKSVVKRRSSPTLESLLDKCANTVQQYMGSGSGTNITLNRGLPIYRSGVSYRAALAVYISSPNRRWLVVGAVCLSLP